MTAHAAVALIAGTFQRKYEWRADPITRSADGNPLFEFQVETSAQHNRRRVITNHLAVAHGPTALRIATTFSAGDFVVVSGDLRAPARCRNGTLSLTVKSAIRVPDVRLSPTTSSLNVAYVVGTVRDATLTELGDGTPVAVLTIACTSPLPGQQVNQYAAVLRGSVRDSVRTLAAGDIVRVDGSVGFDRIGRERMWALRGEQLRVLERCSAPLLPPTAPVDQGRA